jgi:hypothetical protein
MSDVKLACKWGDESTLSEVASDRETSRLISLAWAHLEADRHEEACAACVEADQRRRAGTGSAAVAGRLQLLKLEIAHADGDFDEALVYARQSLALFRESRIPGLAEVECRIQRTLARAEEALKAASGDGAGPAFARLPASSTGTGGSGSLRSKSRISTGAVNEA